MWARVRQLLRPGLCDWEETRDSGWAGMLVAVVIVAPVLLFAGFVVWLWLRPAVPVAGLGCSDSRGRTDVHGHGWTVSHLDDHMMAQCNGTVAYIPVADLPGDRWQSWFTWRFTLAMTGPVRCGFYIHIPRSHAGGPARYYVGGINGDSVGEFTADQPEYSGGLYESPGFRLPDPHRISLVLVNAGRGAYTVVAAAVAIHCAPA